jgi:hypothetical protein
MAALAAVAAMLRLHTRPGHRPFAIRAEDRLQFAGYRVRLGGLDRHQRKRHALHGVGVKQRDRLHHRLDLLPITGQRNQVAGVVGSDDAAAGCNGLEHAPDFGGGDVFELHHLEAGADLLAAIAAIVRPDAGADHGLIGGDDPIQAFGIDEGGVVGPQSGLEQIHDRGFRHRLGRLNRDLALDAGIDGVLDRENIAEDGLGRLRRGDVDEIERDTIGNVFRWPANRAGRRLANEAAGALDDRRLTAAGIGEQRCAAGSIVAALRLIDSGRGNVIPRVRRRRFIDRLARRQPQHEREQQNSKLGCSINQRKRSSRARDHASVIFRRFTLHILSG